MAQVEALHKGLLSTDSLDARVEIVKLDGEDKHDLATAARIRKIVIIEPQSLLRECLACGLRTSARERVFSFSTTAEWLQGPGLTDVALVILSGTHLSDHEIDRELALLCSKFPEVPIVLLAEKNELSLGFAGLEPRGEGVHTYEPAPGRCNRGNAVRQRRRNVRTCGVSCCRFQAPERKLGAWVRAWYFHQPRNCGCSIDSKRQIQQDDRLRIEHV